MMNKDFEQFKRKLIAGAPKMVTMPIYDYDDEEVRLKVAIKSTHDTLKSNLDIAKRALSGESTTAEMQRYLEQQRTRAAITLKQLDHVLSGGWS